MVNITRKIINSRKAIEEDRPWFEIDINDYGVLVTYGNCGNQERPQATRFQMNQSIALAHPDIETHIRPWVFGLDLNGEYQLVPTLELNVNWMAHLAWYYPDTDSWECLEFREI